MYLVLWAKFRITGRSACHRESVCMKELLVMTLVVAPPEGGHLCHSYPSYVEHQHQVLSVLSRILQDQIKPNLVIFQYFQYIFQYSTHFQNPNIFGIRSNFTICDNTALVSARPRRLSCPPIAICCVSSKLGQGNMSSTSLMFLQPGASSCCTSLTLRGSARPHCPWWSRVSWSAPPSTETAC